MTLRIALLAAASLTVIGVPNAAAAQTRRPDSAALPATIPLPDVPFTRFTLKNGLTLIVHQDHKAPMVAINTWYHVGSKNEPRGRSGFAHLFEHLMFNGSENANTDFFKITEPLGATNMNGTTNPDRTNYYESVPTAALDTALWLESDRMGHLLGAVDQGKLDEQRGVVQNEKRQGDNQPYRISEELIIRATYPDEHPYGHSVIGSMDDLNAAKLADVQEWFKTWYGPSNATIVLAGDITPVDALAKVEKYFGDIPPGAPVSHPKAWVAKRSGDQRETAYDRVAQPRLYKVWNTPPAGVEDDTSLDVVAGVLATGKLSRLYKRLVFDEQIATAVQAYQGSAEIGSQFAIVVTGKSGADMARIEREVDEELARLMADGPTASEIDKVKTGFLAGLIRGMESVSGKADLLAQSQVYRSSPDAWRRDAQRLSAVTAAQVQGAAKRWLTDGAYTLAVLPFPDYAAAPVGADRKTMPRPGTTTAPTFPAFKRATLTNGMKVVLAERHGVPTVDFNLIVDTGYAADFAAEKPGTGAFAMSMMDEGTGTRDALRISDDLSRLGASLATSGGGEASYVSLSTLKATLDPALNLYADVIRNPTFEQDDFAREQASRIAAIQSQKRAPSSAATRVTAPLIYGRDHPYGRLTTEQSIGAMTREDLRRFHGRWFGPNNATLVVVGDTTLAEITPKLERAFAGWRPVSTPKITVPDVLPAPTPVVYVIDKPGAAQSVIRAAVVAPVRSDGTEVPIDIMNTVLGGQFISRLNMNLREDKHWAYGAHSGVGGGRGPRLFNATASVQTDKTKESIVEIRKELRDIVKDRLVTAAELSSAQDSLVLALPGAWETNASVASYLGDLLFYGRADDYYSTYAGRLRGTTANAVANAANSVVRNDNLTWIIVGDRAKIDAGLRELNLGDIRYIDADGNSVR